MPCVRCEEGGEDEGEGDREKEREEEVWKRETKKRRRRGRGSGKGGRGKTRSPRIFWTVDGGRRPRKEEMRGGEWTTGEIEG